MIIFFLNEKDEKKFVDRLIGNIPYQIHNNVVISNHSSGKTDTQIDVNYSNKFWFPHEPKTPGSGIIIKEKYTRRALRFLNNITSNEKNLFIIYTRIHKVDENIIKTFLSMITRFNPENKVLLISGSKQLFFDIPEYPNNFIHILIPYLNPCYKNTKRYDPNTNSDEMFKYDFEVHRPLVKNFLIDFFDLPNEKYDHPLNNWIHKSENIDENRNIILNAVDMYSDWNF
jgi:hypothetical protein